MRTALLLLLFMQFTPSLATAQIFGSVRGRLMLPNGLPAAGITVSMRATREAARAVFSEMRVTDAAGRFDFALAPLGTDFFVRAISSNEFGTFFATRHRRFVRVLPVRLR